MVPIIDSVKEDWVAEFNATGMTSRIRARKYLLGLAAWNSQVSCPEKSNGRSKSELSVD